MIDGIFCSLVSNDPVMKIYVLHSITSVLFIYSVPCFFTQLLEILRSNYLIQI